MDQGTAVAAPVSVTTETVVLSRTTIRYSPSAVPFVARVHKVRTRRGKDYSILRVTIPKEIGQKLGVRNKEFLFLMAQKAEWFHMIDWTRMPETFAKLPDDLRTVLGMSGLVPIIESSSAPSLTGTTLGRSQLTPVRDATAVLIQSSPTSA